MRNYFKADAGNLNDLDQHEFAPQGLPAPLVRKLFLGELVNLTSMDVSLNKSAPNTGVSFFHAHKNNEELYIFLKGTGEMMIDGDRFTVTEGNVVKVDPDAKRTWWNTGDEDLYYVVIQAPANGLRGAGVDDTIFSKERVPCI
ncbi:MAG: cupin domain-containing protein [Nitrosospira sp.]|nr:cupin domain-containing protein [Nitrosospira sp.]